ncbi:MAG: alpha/beta fold hydrolase [Gammaproteobacteria bacterium]
MHEPQFVTSSGTPVWIDGDGPTLVLVHGVLMDHRMWALQVAALAPSYRVCCIDMLGHGRAPNPDGPRSLEDFVQQVDEVIDELECDTRPVLGGFSMGGLITQAYAVKHHQKLGGAIILNAVYDRTPEQSTVVRGRFTAMEEKGVEAAVQSANERWFTDEDRATQTDTIEAIISWMREGEFAPKLKAHRVFGTSDGEVTGRLGEVSCPALVMTGDGDGGSTPDMAEAIARALPNAELHVLDNQRHMMPVLDADRVNHVLRQFLARTLGS